MRTTLFSVLLVAMGLGCASGESMDETTERERALRVSMHVEVDDVARAASQARAAAEGAEGFVAESRADDGRAHLEMHVPASTLDGTRADLAELGRVISTSDEAEDVTLAHADARAALASAHAEETRLIAMFADRTSALADVLAVEHELSRVQGEIARFDAEDRALTDRVRMARVSLDLTRSTPAFTSEPLTFVADAASSGLRFAGTLGVGIAGAVAFAAPSLLALFALRLAWRAARRKIA